MKIPIHKTQYFFQKDQYLDVQLYKDLSEEDIEILDEILLISDGLSDKAYGNLARYLVRDLNHIPTKAFTNPTNNQK